MAHQVLLQSGVKDILQHSFKRYLLSTHELPAARVCTCVCCQEYKQLHVARIESQEEGALGDKAAETGGDQTHLGVCVWTPFWRSL